MKKEDRSENWSDSIVIEQQQQQHIGSSSPIRNDTPTEEKPVTVVKKTKKKKDRNENWNDSIATEQQHIGSSSSSSSSSRTKRRKKSEPGVQIIRGSRIYDSENGKFCHQCRQKTLDFVATCTNRGEKKHCTLNVCHKCLFNRYGEKVEEAVALGNWKCPKCRAICNCSLCMKKRGMQPTGILVHSARSKGFSSVSEMLYGKGSESSGAMPKKVDAPNERNHGLTFSLATPWIPLSPACRLRLQLHLAVSISISPWLSPSLRLHKTLTDCFDRFQKISWFETLSCDTALVRFFIFRFDFSDLRANS